MYVLIIFLSVILNSYSIPSWGDTPTLKNPVLLVHGASRTAAVGNFSAFSLDDYFRGVPDFFAKKGVRVNQMKLQRGDSNIESRSFLLDYFIKNEFPNQKVNLICHSMGGLDARYTASILKNPQIASITTIATPHHGTPLATWALNQRKNQTILYRVAKFFGFDMDERRYVEQITPEYLDGKFNTRVIDRSDVQYFSIRSRASIKKGTLGILFWLPSFWTSLEDITLNIEGNDGVVPFLSQGWGTVIADYDFDHLAEINHYWLRFDHLEQSMEIYQRIFEELLKQGL